MRREYDRIPKNNPANRIAGPLSDTVLAKFTEGWSKAGSHASFYLIVELRLGFVVLSINRPNYRGLN